MNNEQAYSLLVQACALFKGNLEEHKMLQTALAMAKLSMLPEGKKSDDISAESAQS